MGTERASQPLSRLRLIASEILAEVYHSSQTLEESVTRVLVRKSAKTFPEFDRAWLYEICSGVLRYRGRLDYLIDTYSLKKKPSGALRRLLQTGIFQILVHEVEPALVVSETVEAIRSAEGDAPSKFANAILRKVADAQMEWREWRVTEASPFAEQLGWCSMPEWLFKKLRKERGSTWVFAFAESVLERPRIWYRTRSETLLLEKGFRGDEPEGFVQDVSNQKLADHVIEILRQRFSQATHPLANQSASSLLDDDAKIAPKIAPKILDLCSAPGGKSLSLAFAGFSVVATDISEDRMQRVVENRSRLKLEREIDIKPYSEVIESEALYDAIWIDAPCSSIGIIRRHPEIKWNRNWTEVEKCLVSQKNLLEWAENHLTKGGIIIYSTCSLLKAENHPPSCLQTVESLEWVPQVGPHGDGISAVIFSN